MNRTQSVAEHESISATAHATAAPDVLPQEQEEEEALAQDHVPEEDEALIFKFETAPSDIEYNQGKLTCLAILYMKGFSDTNYYQTLNTHPSDAANALQHSCTSTSSSPMSGVHT